MNSSKRLVSVLMVATLLIGLLGSPVSASNLPTNANLPELTDEEKEMIQIISAHLDNYVDPNGNVQLKLTNKDELKKQLNNLSGDLITFEELETSIENFNYYVIEGDNAVSDLVDEVSAQLQTNGGIQLMKLTCSDILSIIGLIHSGNLAIAAALLGVSGPAAVSIPILVAAAYTAGSVIGCKL